MQGFPKASLYRILGSAGVTLGMACATLLALEVFLRVCDFRELREGAANVRSAIATMPSLAGRQYTLSLHDALPI